LKLTSSREVVEIDVRMGSLSVSSEKNTVLTTFVGSCVALCIYEPVEKIGGLAHIMLPDSEGNHFPTNNFDAKYADHALKLVLDAMKQKGAEHERMVSKLVGGAKTFSNENSTADTLFNIGERNCASIRVLLNSSKIPILAEELGSTQGRWVKLDINSGKVMVKKRNKEAIL
jgi:chemotaxis protein CheD